MDKMQMIQTTVPEPTVVEIQSRASADGVSVAAWVRRAVVRALEVPTVEAWVVPVASAQQPVEQDRPSTHILREVQRISATEVIYTLTHGRRHDHPGALVSVGWLTDGHTADHSWYVSPDQFRVRLRGSSRPWRIVATMCDDPTQEMRVALQLDTGIRPEVMQAFEHVMRVHAATLEKLAK